MISNIKSTSGLEYILWSKQKASDIYVILTNGTDAFEAEISGRNKPSSILDLSEWNKSILSAMQNTKSASSYEYVAPLLSDPPYYFSIFEVLSAKTKLLLLRCELRRIVGGNVMFHILPHVSVELQSQRDKVNDLMKENQFILKQFSVLEQDMNVITKYKDSMQTVILKQTCLLLNSKKREIVRLNNILSELNGVKKHPLADWEVGCVELDPNELWDNSNTTQAAKRSTKGPSSRISTRANKKLKEAPPSARVISLRKSRKRKLIGNFENL